MGRPQVKAMDKFDLVIRNGTVVTIADAMCCDVGIVGEKIVELGQSLADGSNEVDATNCLVLPGGIDSHCHIEQKSSAGIECADDFYTATVSAAFGGTTTVIPFAAQHRGQSVQSVVDAYHASAGPKAVVDYAFHLIVTDPTPAVLDNELPWLFNNGYTSVKVYMTYDLLKLSDHEILKVLQVARREGAMVMVHAENYEVISWLTQRLLEAGHVEPRYHAVAHAGMAEAEASHRAINLAHLADVPVLLVHVSEPEAIDAIRTAQDRGLRVYGETCPQYLFLTADDLDRSGMDGALYCCSPPPRDEQAQSAVWRGLQNKTFQVFSSDHAPYRLDETGKLAAGPNAPFHKIGAGVPGLELRLPLLFSEGVNQRRLDIHEFVALTATNAAKLYGLYPRKGSISVGADADIAVWAPDLEVTARSAWLHDNAGYCPYEGRRITGWPTTVVRRGEVVIKNGNLLATRGSGQFLPCASPELAQPTGRLVDAVNPQKNFGAHLLDRH